MTEHRLGDLLESVVSGSDSEKFAYNKTGGGILAEVPLKCRGVVASQRRCLTGRGGSDGGEDGPLEYQICQFEVRFGDGAVGVGEADQILGYAGCPLDAPGVVLALLFWGLYIPPRHQCPKRWCSRGQKWDDGPDPQGRWGGLSSQYTGCART